MFNMQCRKKITIEDNKKKKRINTQNKNKLNTAALSYC